MKFEQIKELLDTINKLSESDCKKLLAFATELAKA